MPLLKKSKQVPQQQQPPPSQANWGYDPNNGGMMDTQMQYQQQQMYAGYPPMDPTQMMMMANPNGGYMDQQSQQQQYQQQQPQGYSLQKSPKKSSKDTLSKHSSQSAQTRQQRPPSAPAPELDQSMNSLRTSGNESPDVNGSGSLRPESDEMDVGDDLAGNVRVVIRVRPPNNLELKNGFIKAIECDPGHRSLRIAATDGRERPLTFNRVYDQDVSQNRFFEESGIKELVDQALDGFSVCIFAFGQTGSGKSFTITGPEGVMTSETVGLVPRSLRYLFEEVIARNTTESPVVVKASYIEIYNEHVFDLLNPKGGSLAVRWSAEKGFFVENLFVIDCDVLDDCLAILEEGLRNRTTASHRLNEHSSRSHSVMTLYLEGEFKDPEDGRVIRKHGKISFVDLAGSERVKESNAQGETLTETLNINKSLLTLGKCISALSDAKKRAGHIPYRDSKLTKLLSDSLGGHGLALMVACISPAVLNLTETVKTLRYAQRAKKIKNKPVVNLDPREEMLMMLRKEIQHLRRENEIIKEAITEDPRYEELLMFIAQGKHLIGLPDVTKVKSSRTSVYAASPTRSGSIRSEVRQSFDSSEMRPLQGARLSSAAPSRASLDRNRGKPAFSSFSRGPVVQSGRQRPSSASSMESSVSRVSRGSRASVSRIGSFRKEAAGGSRNPPPARSAHAAAGPPRWNTKPPTSGSISRPVSSFSHNHPQSTSNTSQRIPSSAVALQKSIYSDNYDSALESEYDDTPQMGIPQSTLPSPILDKQMRKEPVMENSAPPISKKSSLKARPQEIPPSEALPQVEAVEPKKATKASKSSDPNDSIPSEKLKKKANPSISEEKPKVSKKDKVVRSESPETILSESEPEQKPVVSRKKDLPEEGKIITSSRGKTSSKPKRPTEDKMTHPDDSVGNEIDDIVRKVKEKKRVSGKEAGIDDLPPIATTKSSRNKSSDKEGDPSMTKELSKLKKKTMRDVEALDVEIQKLSQKT